MLESVGRMYKQLNVGCSVTHRTKKWEQFGPLWGRISIFICWRGRICWRAVAFSSGRAEISGVSATVSFGVLVERKDRTLSSLSSHWCDARPVGRIQEKSMCVFTWEPLWWAEVVYNTLDIKTWDEPDADDWFTCQIFILFSFLSCSITNSYSGLLSKEKSMSDAGPSLIHSRS